MLTREEMQVEQTTSRQRPKTKRVPLDDRSARSAIGQLLEREKKETTKIVDKHIKNRA